MIYCFSCRGSLRLGVLEGNEGGKKKRVHSLQLWNITPYMFLVSKIFFFFCSYTWTIWTFSMLHNLQYAWWETVSFLSTCRVSEVNRQIKKKPGIIFQFKPTINPFAGKCSTSPRVSEMNILYSIHEDESVLCTLTPKRLLKELQKQDSCLS